MFLKSLNIAGSALTAEQYRLNLIAQNITNVETTRTENGGPYKRKTPIYQEISDSAYDGASFSNYLIGNIVKTANKNNYNSLNNYNYNLGTLLNNITPNTNKAVYIKPNLGGYALNNVNPQTSGNFVRNKYSIGINDVGANGGVKVAKVIEDPTPGKMVYDPEHPDADENGYVEMPNVEMVQEMVDMMGAGRAYEANVQVVNAIKAMASRALEIGR